MNEPVLAGWRDGQLYLEVHPPLAEDERDPMQLARDAIEVALAGRNLRPSPAAGMAPGAGALAAADVAETALAEDADARSDIAHIDWERVAGIVDARRGLPFPILGSAGSPTDYLAAVRVIENIVPLPTEQSTASR